METITIHNTFGIARKNAQDGPKSHYEARNGALQLWQEC